MYYVFDNILSFISQQDLGQILAVTQSTTLSLNCLGAGSPYHAQAYHLSLNQEGPKEESFSRLKEQILRNALWTAQTWPLHPAPSAHTSCLDMVLVLDSDGISERKNDLFSPLPYVNPITTQYLSLKYHFHIFSCPWLPQKQPPDKTQPIKCKGYTARQIFFFFTLCYLFWTLAKTTILNQRLINLCSHNFSTNIKRLSTIRRAGYINCSTVVFTSFDIFRAFITSLLYTLTMQLWLVFLNLTHESKLG